MDVLINNAGIDAKALGADDGMRGALDITAEQFRGVFDVNVVGPLLLVQLLAAQPPRRAWQGRQHLVTGRFIVGCATDRPRCRLYGVEGRARTWSRSSSRRSLRAPTA